jgi:HAMP domain-containing protein
MKLTLKFNLIFLVVFGLGLAATGFIARRFLEESARGVVTEQARLMMETSASTRSYTAREIRPILNELQHKGGAFYPQSVPAFSAIKIFSYLRDQRPDYTYREPALNPTNPADRAADWEADVINAFKNDPKLPELVRERNTPNGRSLFIAKPMRADESCMPCHSVPAAAPPAMIKMYGANNGFGWKRGDVVAAQVVNVPMAVPEAIATKAIWQLMLGLTAVALISLAVLNVVLVFAVIRPIARLSAAADEISKGNLDTPELTVAGKDEVSVLADSFNRMHRSLVKALKMLEE